VQFVLINLLPRKFPHAEQTYLPSDPLHLSVAGTVRHLIAFSFPLSFLSFLFSLLLLPRVSALYSCSSSVF
jgi:hypothetical protein